MFRKIDISNLSQISPKIYDLSKNILFADIWQREQLDIKTRCLITITTLIILGRYSQLQWHIENALKQGVNKEQILELSTHLVFYVGLPTVISALEHMPEEIWSCP
ncbi:carboxymuconolactone decarboxylase family protein [Acinetobacter qingfengensis]|uniref:4-carboxymuconolactone decarboxylase n=1 Tax=Acinetobacter qingfengensis TaxID=1262585 RepID=A0A1E7QXI7_9GAMM|nr:carboxymuconolactone decarboxylase family protein [Acinetobacter qingfengensis]KAA8731679.1 carboxymuconolactone decarboxylase family protein [Acinetobacter qingfengensis]OEY91782.1 4-carboxymuconolactone decarboxylase [Acinetobacter qingfengensis]